MGNKFKHYSILITDDDEGDRFLIQKAMAESGLQADLHFMEDGQKLVESLQEHLALVRNDPEPEMPCLILLDLNMPRMDGREALRAVKAHDQLRKIPVIVLTGSKNTDDIEGSYRDGANSFFTKPMEYKKFVELMRLIRTYWFQNAELPFRRV